MNTLNGPAQTQCGAEGWCTAHACFTAHWLGLFARRPPLLAAL